MPNEQHGSQPIRVTCISTGNTQVIHRGPVPTIIILIATDTLYSQTQCLQRHTSAGGRATVELQGSMSGWGGVSYVYHYTPIRSQDDSYPTAIVSVACCRTSTPAYNQHITSSCVLQAGMTSARELDLPDFLTPFSFVRGSRGLLAACCLLGCQPRLHNRASHSTPLMTQTPEVRAWAAGDCADGSTGCRRQAQLRKRQNPTWRRGRCAASPVPRPSGSAGSRRCGGTWRGGRRCGGRCWSDTDGSWSGK